MAAVVRQLLNHTWTCTSGGTRKISRGSTCGRGKQRRRERATDDVDGVENRTDNPLYSAFQSVRRPGNRDGTGGPGIQRGLAAVGTHVPGQRKFSLSAFPHWDTDHDVLTVTPIGCLTCVNSVLIDCYCYVLIGRALGWSQKKKYSVSITVRVSN